MVQAIETEYAGRRFRSRLEARWAVFLDHLDLKWLYEPQGYLLGNGERYLPDYAGCRIECAPMPASVADAYDAARKARFEHGESGAAT